MINSAKVYIVRPLFEHPEAFTNKVAADRYMHLCELMGHDPQIITYECDTLNFRDYCESSPYYDVYYFTHKDALQISPSNIKNPDMVDNLDYVDEGLCIISCFPSSDPSVQALFLRGDEQPLKDIMKGKVPVNESDLS